MRSPSPSRVRWAVRRFARKYGAMKYAIAFHESMNPKDFIEHVRQFDLPALHRVADQIVGSRKWTSRIERHPETYEILRELLPKSQDPRYQPHLDLLMKEIRQRHGHLETEVTH